MAKILVTSLLFSSSWVRQATYRNVGVRHEHHCRCHCELVCGEKRLHLTEARDACSVVWEAHFFLGFAALRSVARRTAVCSMLLSVSSNRPPGSAVSPPCDESFFDLRVRSTYSRPLCPTKRGRATPALRNAGICAATAGSRMPSPLGMYSDNRTSASFDVTEHRAMTSSGIFRLR